VNIFLNDDHHLRSGWRFSIFFAATFIVVFLAVAIVAVFTVLAWGPTGSQQFFTTRGGFLLQGVALVLGAFFVGWGCVKWFEQLKARSLGWALHRGWFRDLVLGSVLGAVTLGLAAAISGIVGGYKPELNHNYSSVGLTLGIGFLIFFIAAAGEEAVFRGYGLQTMTRANLAALGIALTSVPFAVVHLNNPHVSKWFTFANTVLAGVWLGLAYLKTRSLWFALGLHWAWNWTMGAVLGVPVSGVTNITPEPLMHLRYPGPAWLTGGDYGFEGGLACTIAILISIALVWWLPFPRASEEMIDASPEEFGPAQVWTDPNRQY
jgi:membrane protease YdiL (CAAX protease family)